MKLNILPAILQDFEYATEYFEDKIYDLETKGVLFILHDEAPYFENIYEKDLLSQTIFTCMAFHDLEPSKCTIQYLDFTNNVISKVEFNVNLTAQ